MFTAIPFWPRALFLLFLMAIGAGIDVWRRGPAATRPKEYGYICLTGLIGAAVGAATDFVTSHISPEYFTLGKDLPPGARQAVLFGAQEGISSGVIAGALLVYVSHRKTRTPPMPFSKLIRLTWIPVSLAIFGSCVLPFMIGQSDPAHLRNQLVALVPLPPGGEHNFLRVWWIHVGLYSGLVIGQITLLWLILRFRKWQT